MPVFRALRIFDQVVHHFQAKNRPPVPGQAVHLFRGQGVPVSARRMLKRCPATEIRGRPAEKMGWSYFVGQSEGKVKVDSDWV